MKPRKHPLTSTHFARSLPPRSVKRDVFASIYEHMVQGRTRCLEMFRECHSLHDEDVDSKSSPRKRTPTRKPPPGTMSLSKPKLERFLRQLVPVGHDG